MISREKIGTGHYKRYCKNRVSRCHTNAHTTD